MPDLDKPARGRPRTFDKDHVADVAMQAYWEEGPAEVSLNAVCERAGVSKPSVYREFGNDDGVTHAALSHYAETVLVRMHEIVTSDADYRNKIAGIIALSSVDATHDHGCLLVKMRAVRDRMGPRTQELIDRIEAMSRDAFIGLLSDGRDAGDLPEGVSVDLGARYLQAQVGLALDHRARGLDPKPILDLALSVLGVSVR